MADEIERLEKVLSGVRQIDTESFTENAIDLSVETPQIRDNLVGYGVEVGNKLIELGAGLLAAVGKVGFEFRVDCEKDETCSGHWIHGRDCKKQISVRDREIWIDTYHSYEGWLAYGCSVSIIPHKTKIIIAYDSFSDRIKEIGGICHFRKKNSEEAFGIFAEHYHPGTPAYITECVEEFLSMPLLLDSVVKEMRKGAQMQQALEDKMEAIRRLGR